MSRKNRTLKSIRRVLRAVIAHQGNALPRAAYDVQYVPGRNGRFENPETGDRYSIQVRLTPDASFRARYQAVRKEIGV